MPLRCFLSLTKLLTMLKCIYEQINADARSLVSSHYSFTLNSVLFGVTRVHIILHMILYLILYMIVVLNIAHQTNREIIY